HLGVLAVYGLEDAFEGLEVPDSHTSTFPTLWGVDPASAIRRTCGFEKRAKMKTRLLLLMAILGPSSVLADDRTLLVEGICHEIRVESDSVLIFPLNHGLTNEKAPYFIS